MNVGRFGYCARALAAATTAVAVLAFADDGQAQESGSVSVDPRAGVAFPVGGLDDVNDFGVSLGTGVSYRLNSYLSVRGDFRYSHLASETDEDDRNLAPALDVLQYTAGVEFDFPPPRWQSVPLSFRMNLGFGGTSMSGSETFTEGGSVDFEQTYPTLTTGGMIGVPVSDRVEAFVSSEVYLIFADESDTAALTARTPGADPFGTGWTVPLTLGVRAVLR